MTSSPQENIMKPTQLGAPLLMKSTQLDALLLTEGFPMIPRAHSKRYCDFKEGLGDLT